MVHSLARCQSKALSDYALHWYGKAGDPLDYALQVELAKHYAGRPMATGKRHVVYSGASLMCRPPALR